MAVEEGEAPCESVAVAVPVPEAVGVVVALEEKKMVSEEGVEPSISTLDVCINWTHTIGG